MTWKISPKGLLLLPEGLSVGGFLDLRGTQITDVRALGGP